MAITNFRKDEPQDNLDHLMCQAHRCPNRWSVDRGSRLCSAHAWEEPHKWPQITESLFYKTNSKQTDNLPPIKFTEAEKREVIQNLRQLSSTNQDQKQWAKVLRQKEQAGENLSKIQREAWRTALKHHA